MCVVSNSEDILENMPAANNKKPPELQGRLFSEVREIFQAKPRNLKVQRPSAALFARELQS